MDNQRKKELREQFSEMKTLMGVYRITNTQNGKIFIDAVSNIKNKWLTEQMMLDSNRHVNSALQQDWKAFGKDAFVYDVVEEVAVEADTDVKYEVKKLLKKWLDALQPYGEKGYNKERQ